MREPSDHPAKEGWYHPYAGKVQRTFRPPAREVTPSMTNGEELMMSWECLASFQTQDYLARKLGVSRESLSWLRCAWAPVHKAWAFPMRDGDGKIVGIRLRNEAGDKWAVKGSRQGLFIPAYFEGDQRYWDMCFVTEGPTDCAAMLSLGLYAIGRPSCNANPDQLKIALKNHQIRRVVIVSDNDDKRRLNGQQWSPGLDGAKALGAALKLPHVIYVPPMKDVRDFLNSGGTKQLIMQEIASKVWKR